MKFLSITLFLLYIPACINTPSSDIKQDVFSHPKYHLSFSPLETVPTAGSERVDLIANLENVSERFICWIPVPSAKEVESQARRSEEELRAVGVNALKGLPCLQFVAGYWTYEFCQFRAVKQFHQSENERKEFVLGRHSTSVNARVLSVNDTTVYSYLSLVLGEGTLCDLNSKPREVVIYCAPGDREYIGKIAETSSCRYSLSVYTPRLCSAGSEFVPRAVFEETTISCRGRSSGLLGQASSSLRLLLEKRDASHPTYRRLGTHALPESKDAPGLTLSLLEVAKKLLEGGEGVDADNVREVERDGVVVLRF